MPMDYAYGYGFDAAIARRQAAEKAVLAKYPNIIKGSSGWHRAMAAKLRKRR